MARAINRLSTRAVASLKKPGYHPDGANLFLQIGPALTRSWVFKYTLNGRSREGGLGSVNDVSLAEARERARAYRQLLAENIDPVDFRRAQRAKHAAESAHTITFEKAVEKYIDAHGDGRRNPKHRRQWEQTLATYCGPVFGTMPVHLIDTAHVLRVLEPEWKTKTETLKRLRGRVEQVLDWCRVRGFRSGENPARWRGHLDKLLAAPSKVQKRTHLKAMPYAEVGEFMQRLREQDGMGSLALQFTILCAARSGETRGATWAEVDLNRGLWTIDGRRMKSGRTHTVPLPKQALALLKKVPRSAETDLVFWAPRGGQLSDMTLTACMRRLGADATVHGFRSTFSTWTAEQTAFPAEVREAALAHVSADKVATSYMRSTFEEQRAKLMAQWADYCDRPAGGDVVPIGKARKAGKRA